MTKKIFFLIILFFFLPVFSAYKPAYKTCSVDKECSGRLFCVGIGESADGSSGGQPVCKDGKCVCPNGDYARTPCADNRDICAETTCPEGFKPACSVGTINDRTICICVEEDKTQAARDQG